MFTFDNFVKETKFSKPTAKLKSYQSLLLVIFPLDISLTALVVSKEAEAGAKGKLETYASQ